MSLVGGSAPREGNVLVDGRPVCDDSWGALDAEVVCRMLGFVSGAATTQSTFGPVSGDFIMDDVECEGDEGDIRECQHSAGHNCGVMEGAGVRCAASESLSSIIQKETT